MIISFTVNAVPIAQPRQRHAMIGGYIRNYTPSKHPVQKFKAMVAHEASLAHKGQPIEGPIEIVITAFFPRPKYMITKKKPMTREWKDTKPDIDNIQKSIFDALKGIVWTDDCQICVCKVTKVVCAGDESAHVDIIVHTIMRGCVI